METSILAKKTFEAEGKKEKHYMLIKKSLKHLGVACATEIGKHSGLTQHQVSRRVKELENNNEIYVVKKDKTKFHKTIVNIYALRNG